MKPIILVPLVALVLVGGSAGAYLAVTSEGSVEEAVIAQPTPTPEPAATSQETPSTLAAPAEESQLASAPTPVPAPAEEGKAPDGCSAGELAYVDPDSRFAFCYPADMEVAQADTGSGIAANVRDPADTKGELHIIFGLRVEPYSLCGIDSDTIVRNEKIEPFVIDGNSVQACFKDHFDPVQPDVLLFKTIDFMVTTEGGRPVIVLVTHSPSATRNAVPVQDIAARILHSAAIS